MGEIENADQNVTVEKLLSPSARRLLVRSLDHVKMISFGETDFQYSIRTLGLDDSTRIRRDPLMQS